MGNVNDKLTHTHTQIYLITYANMRISVTVVIPLKRLSIFGFFIEQAKNVILFLGDGMSIPTLAAARIYMGQLANRTGEEISLAFEQFPFTGLSKVRKIMKFIYPTKIQRRLYFRHIA
jgi:Alkaline phosphatase